jgi:hypothetical protein
MPDFGLSSARAEASRRNGAKSRGPKTAEGKARSSQNALTHGLRAQKHMLLPGESAAEYQRLEAALMEELAPEGALQAVLARRVVAAAWRLERVEQIEVQLFAWNQLDGGGRNLGLALIRDCNNARAFDTLLRYRGGTLAEFWRALRTLKALQAEQAAVQQEAAAAPEPVGARLAPSPAVGAPDGAARGPNPFLARAPGEGEAEMPSKPEHRTNPHDSVPAPLPAPTPAPAPAPVAASVSAPARPRPQQPPCGAALAPRRIEPKRRANPGEAAPSMPHAGAESCKTAVAPSEGSVA